MGIAPRSAFPKDGINDHVVDGASDGQPRAGRDEGGAALHSCRRSRSDRDDQAPLRPPRDRRRRRRPAAALRLADSEADAFYASVLPATLTA